MSSSEAENRSSNKPPPAKKPRIPRVGMACDRCRKRKMKCDGRIGGEPCLPCVQNGWACEYMHAMQKYQVGYVKALENKIERLQRVLGRLHPHDDFTKEVGSRLTEDNWAQNDFLNSAHGTPEPALRTPSTFVSAKGSPSSEPNAKSEEVADVDENDQASKLRELTDEFKHLTLGTYHGPFSSAGLVHSALNLTFEFTGARLSMDDLSRFGRPQFWRFNPWEYIYEHPMFDFPPPDLLQTLVDLYFDHLNPYMPVLHRPTFMRQLSMGRQNVDLSFGFLLLNVCANGARFSEDPRVMLPGADTQSAGWYWFNQVRGRSSMHNGSSRLYDLQSVGLATMYLMGCSAMQASWVWCRHGISLAQDVGAHKKRAYSTVPNVEDEQFRRVFWVLVLLDRFLSVGMGRPYATKDDELDLDRPIACDDEYWEHPDPVLAFKQPEGRPSRIDYLVSVIELTQSVGPGMYVVFAGAKGRASLGTPAEGWERETIADLDSRHTVWADSVPEHIRWDPGGKDDIFYLQAAHLWTWFHDGQIILHRPFITPRPNTPPDVAAELGFPFLTICLSAARAIVRILESVQQRLPGQLFPLLQKPVYEAGMMLFLGIWGSKKFGISSTSRIEEDLQGIHTCMQFLETLETRIHPAGRHRDVMNALLSLVELPTPALNRGQKRSLDEDESVQLDQSVPLHSDALASLDDWFAGAQFDPAQCILPSVNGPAGASADNPWDAMFQTNDLSSLGASDPFGAAPSDIQLPWAAFSGGNAAPPGSWGLPGDGSSTAHDPLAQLFGVHHDTQADPNQHSFGSSSETSRPTSQFRVSIHFWAVYALRHHIIASVSKMIADSS
ncbi:hypothetical protein PENSPDRAFT_757416 [Peniophora sp. CONT]|nr:hypothetical protein PENSPDRAFT_757416 [Peniophora sp. CONT]